MFSAVDLLKHANKFNINSCHVVETNWQESFCSDAFYELK